LDEDEDEDEDDGPSTEPSPPTPEDEILPSSGSGLEVKLWAEKMGSKVMAGANAEDGDEEKRNDEAE